MRPPARAGALLTVACLALGSVYLVADGADLVPGFFTFKPPLPQVAPFPQIPQRVVAASEVPEFAQNQDIDVKRLKSLAQDFLSDYRMKDTQVSLWIGDTDGVEVLSHNSNAAYTAASTTKILTAAAVLHEFSATDRARTLVAFDPQQRKLFLIAGGDISLDLGADSPQSVTGYAGLKTLATQTVTNLIDSQGNSLLGAKPYTLVVDTSWFGTQSLNPKWRQDDNRWVAPIQGIAINTGRVNPQHLNAIGITNPQ